MNPGRVHRGFLDHSGSAMALALLALLILSGVALSLGSLSLLNHESAVRDANLTRAAYIARAAMERATAEILTQTADWATLSPGDLYLGEAFAGGTYDVQLLASNQNAAVLHVTATVDGQTSEFETLVRRRTDAGGGVGTTMGASFERLVDLRLDPTASSLASTL